MFSGGQLRCDICGALRHHSEIRSYSAEAHINEVQVTRNVTHCWDDINCSHQARFQAEEFVERVKLDG